MFGKKKKVSSVANKDELAALDSSVNELSKQTSELLKGFGEKPQNSDDGSSKSKLSTESTKSKARTGTAMRRGKSFDIIQNPKTRTSLKGTLKTTDTQPDEEHALLPEHATDSYNEGPTTPKQSPIHDVAPSNSTGASTPHLIGHRAGSLQLASETGDATESGSEHVDLVDTAPEELKTEDESAVEPTQPVHGSMDQGITFAEEATKKDLAQDDKRATEEQSDEVSESPEPTAEDTMPEAENKGADETQGGDVATEEAKQDVDDATLNLHDSGELFANNLVHDSKPQSYTPLESQQKPTVFDTNEYHVELHDWSKLEHKSHGLWYILVLLITVAAALAYFLFSGQEIPFIG